LVYRSDKINQPAVITDGNNTLPDDLKDKKQSTVTVPLRKND